MTAGPHRDKLLRLEKPSYFLATFATLGVALTVLAYMVALWHVRLIRAEYPQDYAENATYLSTVLLLEGENPWALANQPQFANVYGILYNLVALPAAGVFGCSFALHRILSALCLLLCCLAILLTLRRYHTPILLASIAPIIFYQQYMPTYQSNIKPDNLGLLLFLGALLYPWYRGFSTRSLLVSGVLAVLALYTKVYFAVALVYVSGYVFLFESMRKALLYLVLSLGALAVSVVLVGLTLEAYWTDVFFVQLNDSFAEWGFFVDQLTWYVRINFGLLGLLGLVGLGWIIARARAHQRLERPSFTRPRDWRAPLLPQRLDFVTFALLFSITLLLAGVGWRSGNFGLYFHQFLTPFLLIVAFRAIAMARVPRVLLVALPGLQLLYSFAAFYPLREPEKREWQNWEALLAEYDGDVFVAPVFAHIVLKQGKTIYDDGQTQYIPMGVRHNVRSTKRKLKARLGEFEREIQDKLAREAFSVIIQKRDYCHYVLGTGVPAEHYTRAAENKMCRTAFNAWEYDIWVPAHAPAASHAAVPRDGLALRLRADTGVEADADGGVLAWADQSGHGHRVLPAATSRRPKWVAADHAVRFDGLDDTLQVSGVEGIHPAFTALLVLRPAALPGHNQTIQTRADAFVLGGDCHGGLLAGVGRETCITPSDGPGPGTLVPGAWQLLEYVATGQTARLYKNGILAASKPAGVPADWSGFQLGSPSVEMAFAGDIGAVMLYERALSNDERRVVERHLMGTFGILDVPAPDEIAAPESRCGL